MFIDSKWEQSIIGVVVLALILAIVALFVKAAKVDAKNTPIYENCRKVCFPNTFYGMQDNKCICDMMKELK